MAVRTSTFEIAALDADKPAPDADENVAEIQLGAKVFSLWRRPSAGQFAMLQLRMTRNRSDEVFKAMDRFLGALVLTPAEVVAHKRKDEHGVLYADRIKDGERAFGAEDLWELYESGSIEMEDLSKLMRAAIEAHAGFPTESSPASSRGREKTGPPSTATSRRNRSTPSD